MGCTLNMGVKKTRRLLKYRKRQPGVSSYSCKFSSDGSSCQNHYIMKTWSFESGIQRPCVKQQQGLKGYMRVV